MLQNILMYEVCISTIVVQATVNEELITYAEGLSLLYLVEDLPRGGGADPLFDSRLIFS